MKRFNNFINESKLTDNEWVELVRKCVDFYHKGLRLGQSYMNALALINKELYDEITGTEYDPYYDDDNLHKFINYLNERL
jgi:hypothetical protein